MLAILQHVDVLLARTMLNGNLVPYTTPYTAGICTNFIMYYGDRMRFLEKPLRIFICPQSIIDNSPVNHAIYNLVQHSVPTPWPWCGPVLIMKHADITCGDKYIDICDTDILDVAAYFRLVI